MSANIPEEELLAGGIKARLLAYQQAAKTKRALKKQRSSENLTEIMNASTGQIARNLQEAVNTPKVIRRSSKVGKLDSSKIAKFHDTHAGMPDLHDSGHLRGPTKSQVFMDDEQQRKASENFSKALGAVGDHSGKGHEDSSRHHIPEFVEARKRYLDAVQKLAPAPLPEQKGEEKKRAIERESMKKGVYGSLKKAWDEFEVAAKDRPREPTDYEIKIKAEVAQLEDRIDKEWIKYAEKVVKRAVEDGDTDEAEIGQWRNEAVRLQRESEIRRKQKIKQEKMEEERYWKEEAERLRAELGDESELGSDEEWVSDSEGEAHANDGNSELSQKALAVDDAKAFESPTIASPKDKVVRAALSPPGGDRSSFPRRASTSIAEKALIFSSPKTALKSFVKPPLSTSERSAFPTKVATKAAANLGSSGVESVRPKKSFVPRKTNPPKKEVKTMDRYLERLVQVMTEIDGDKESSIDEETVRHRYKQCLFKLVPSEFPINLQGAVKLSYLDAEYKKKTLYGRLQLAWDLYQASSRNCRTHDKEKERKLFIVEDMIDCAWLGFAKAAVENVVGDETKERGCEDGIDKWRTEAMRLRTLMIKRKRRKGRKVSVREAEAAAAAEQGNDCDSHEQQIYRLISPMLLNSKVMLTPKEVDDRERQLLGALQNVAPESQWNASYIQEEDRKLRVLAEAKRRANMKALVKLNSCLSSVDGTKKKCLNFADAKGRYIQAMKNLAPSHLPVNSSAGAKKDRLLQEARKKKKYDQLKSEWDAYESTLNESIQKKDVQQLDRIESLIDSAWTGFARSVVKEATETGESYDGEVERWREEAMKLKAMAVARKRRKRRKVTKKEAALAAAAAAGIDIVDNDTDEKIYQHISSVPRENLSGDQEDDIFFGIPCSSRPGMRNPWDALSDSEEESPTAEAIVRRPELLSGTAFDDSFGNDDDSEERHFYTISGLRVGQGNPWDELSDEEELTPAEITARQASTLAKLGELVSEVLGEEHKRKSFSAVRSSYVEAVKRLAPSVVPIGMSGEAKRNALLQEARKKEQYTVLKKAFDAYENVASDKPKDSETDGETARVEDLADKAWIGFAKEITKEVGSDVEVYQDEIDRWKIEAMRMKAEALARKRRKKRKVTKQEAAVAAAAAAGFDDGQDAEDERIYQSISSYRPGMPNPWEQPLDDDTKPADDFLTEEEEAYYGPIRDRAGMRNPWDDLSDDEVDREKAPSSPEDRGIEGILNVLAEISGKKSDTRSFGSIRDMYLHAVHTLAPSAMPVDADVTTKKNILQGEMSKKRLYDKLRKHWDVYETLAKDKDPSDLIGEARVHRAEDLVDRTWAGFAATVANDIDFEYKDDIAKWREEARRLKAQALKRKRRKGRKVSVAEVEEVISIEKGETPSDYDMQIYQELCGLKSSYPSPTDTQDIDAYEDRIFGAVSNLRPGSANFWDSISSSEEEPLSKAAAQSRAKEKAEASETLSKILSSVCESNVVLDNYSCAQARYVEALHKLAPAVIPRALQGATRKNFLLEESRKKDTFEKLTEAFDRYEASVENRPVDCEADRKLTLADDLAVRAWAGFANSIKQLDEKEGDQDDEEYDDEVARWKAEAESLKAKALARKRRKRRKVTKDEAAAAAAASAGLPHHEQALDLRVYRQLNAMREQGSNLSDDEILNYAERVFDKVSLSRPGGRNPWDDLSDASEEEPLFAREKSSRPELIQDSVFENSDSSDGLYEEYKYSSTLSGLRAGQGNPWDDLSDEEDLPPKEAALKEEKAASKLNYMISKVLGDEDQSNGFQQIRKRYMEAVEKQVPEAIPPLSSGKAKANFLRREATKREQLKAMRQAFDAFEAISKEKLGDDREEESKANKVEDLVESAWSGFAKAVLKAADNDPDVQDEEYRDEIDRWREEATRMKAAALARKRRKKRKVTRNEAAVATAAAAGFNDGEDSADEQVYRSISNTRPGMPNPWDGLSDDEDGQAEEQSEAEEEPTYGAISSYRVGMQNPWDALSDDEKVDHCPSAEASKAVKYSQKSGANSNFAPEELQTAEEKHIGRLSAEESKAVKNLQKSGDDSNFARDKLQTAKEEQAKVALSSLLADISDSGTEIELFTDARLRYANALHKLSPEAMPPSISGAQKTEHLRREAEKKIKYESLKKSFDAYVELAQDKVGDDDELDRRIAADEDKLDKLWSDFAKSVVKQAQDDSVSDSDYEDEIDKWREEARRIRAEALRRKKKKGRRISQADVSEAREQLEEAISDIYRAQVDLSVDYAGALQQYVAAAEKVGPGAFSSNLSVKKKREILQKEAAKKQSYEALKDAWLLYEQVAEDKPDPKTKAGLALETQVDRIGDKMDSLWESFAKKIAKEADFGSDSESDSDYDDELDRWKLEARKLKAEAAAKRERRAQEGKIVHKNFDDEAVVDQLDTNSLAEEALSQKAVAVEESSESKGDSNSESESESDSSDSDSDDSSREHKRKRNKKKEESKKKKKKEKRKKKKVEKKSKRDKLAKRPPDKHNLKEDTLGEVRNMDGTLWKNPLRFWKNKTKVDIEGAAITMRVSERSDFWRKTGGAAVADSGPFYWHKITGNFELIVKISSTMSSDMDKAGLMIRLDEANYIMTGMESFGGRVFHSSLVTLDSTDQSLCILPVGAEKQGIWFCFKRYHNAFECFYSYDALLWFQTRQGVFTDRPVLSVGIAAACPSGDSFKATFEYYRVKAV